MHRFFVSPDCINGRKVELPGDVARQLARVLRARVGGQIVVLDDTGWEYAVVLDTVSPNRASGSILRKMRSSGEPGIVVMLYQAVLKSTRFEFALQKGTELGASRFVPMFCARSIPRAREQRWADSRMDRWKKIVKEAAEQSHRGRIPLIETPASFAHACETVEGLAVIPWERERETGLRAVLEQAKSDGERLSSVGVFIGPEGGFTENEIELARSKGIIPVSLGGRVLRAETAGLAAVSAILYEMGELGG